jgi:shikimate dehydrogenase
VAISARSPVYAVLGHPVGHSVSPAMQNAALAAMGLDGVYVAFEVAPERLAEAVRGIRALGLAGVNVTIPHKEAILPLLDRLDPQAELIGAVNTLVPRNGELIGRNTDAPGFLRSLQAAGAEPKGARILLLGAGGSAKAVGVALAQAGASLTIVNRTPARATALAGLLNERVRRGCAAGYGWERSVLEEAIATADILVNTTSIGMHPKIDAAPEIPIGALRSESLVYDLIYNPWESRFLAQARERGCRAVNGAAMLAWQGALALELWTGRPAPAELMERVIREQLVQ